MPVVCHGVAAVCSESHISCVAAKYSAAKSKLASVGTRSSPFGLRVACGRDSTAT